MMAQTQIEATKSALKELFDVWDSRADSYGGVLYSSAVVRDTEVWRNVISFLLPLHKTEQRSTKLSADYGDFKIAQGLISLEQAKTLLTEMVEREQLCFPGLPPIGIKAFLHPSSKYFWRSGTRRFPVNFPFFEYGFSVEQGYKARPPQRTIWATDLPLYPSGRTAIERLLFTCLGDDSSYEGVLTALAPDYRGKIREIRLSNQGVQIQVQCLWGASEEDLIGKLYCEDYYGNGMAKDLAFKSGQAFTETKEFPRRLVIALLSRTGKDLIDERVFDAASPYPTSDLVLEVIDQDVAQLVRGGESDTLEFKSQIPSKQEAIAIAAVAFANRSGGRILVGVDDNGQITGCPTEKAKDTLTNILRDNCEPPLQFEIAEAKIRDMRILIVIVPEGREKPYQVKDKGFYVRTGATNRLVTRYELDEMYGRKSRWGGL